MSIPSVVMSLLKPVLEHRLKAYAETAAEDAALLAKDLRRRVIGAAFALTGVLMSLILGSAWIVGTAWNTPWRNPAMAVLLGVYLLCALIGAALALWPPKPDHGPFARLRRQVGTDLLLLRTLVIPDDAQQERSLALGLLMQGGSASGADGTFPKSTVMRVVLAFTGLARILK